MEKNRFVSNFIGEDESLISSLFDKIEICLKTDTIVYSDVFLPPKIWSKLIELEGHLGLLIEAKGLKKESEKKIVAFKSYTSYEELDFPVKLIKIESNSKFYQLEHRHFLREILSVGIKREKLGDLIVEDGDCYTILHSSLYEFLQNNLSVVGKSKVEISEVGEKIIPSYKFKEENYLLASFRLDVIVSTLTNESRNEALKLINSSKVTVNYKVETNKSLVIKKGDIISIRQHGKYVFLKNNGETKRGKQKGIFKKYI